MLYQKLVEEHISEPGVILSYENQSLTMLQVHKVVMGILSAFQARGLMIGDRVLVTDVNPMGTALTLLACLAGGFVCVPISHRLDKLTQSEIIRVCRPALIINDTPEEIALTSLPERRILEKETLVYILFTSGSEGVPKGVTASQKQVSFCCQAISERLCLCHTDRILCTLPLSFDYGLYQVFLSFWNRAALFLDTGDTIQRIPYLLNHYKITIFPAVPTALSILSRTGLLYRCRFPCLRTITFTGEVLPIPLIQTLYALFPLVEIIPMYGLTECKRVSIMPPGKKNMVLAGSCGLPLDGVSVYLERKNQKNGIGQLVVEGENVMEGYWGLLGKDGETFFHCAETGKYCVRTGDLFRIGQGGFLFFYGRISDILKIRGHRISGTWLESRLMTGTTSEIAAVGVTSSLTGEYSALLVSTDNPTEVESARIRAELRKLPEYVKDIPLFFLDKPLPKTPNGKIDRKMVKQIVEAML